MTMIEILRKDAEFSWQELLLSLEGVTEGQAWAVLPNLGPDYLHTDASIFGVMMHCACQKWISGSVCFRDTEIRWRDLAEQVAEFEPSWEAGLDYLRRGHEYWMESWAGLEDVEEVRPTNWKRPMPAWELLRVINQHDSYHAGQIAVLRYGVGESVAKPSSVAEDIRTHCRTMAAW